MHGGHAERMRRERGGRVAHQAVRGHRAEAVEVSGAGGELIAAACVGETGGADAQLMAEHHARRGMMVVMVVVVVVAV